ncbi:hypothetical protein C0J52_08634, partial [Blattella germanica]
TQTLLSNSGTFTIDSSRHGPRNHHCATRQKTGTIENMLKLWLLVITLLHYDALRTLVNQLAANLTSTYTLAEDNYENK